MAQALRERPDVLAARLTAESAAAFADAEGDLWFPSISAVGAAGVTPYHQVGIDDRYAAAAVNVTVPILTAACISARHAEASLRARGVAERLRDLENQVRATCRWRGSTRGRPFSGSISRASCRAGRSALDLAQARYDLGLSSIVELTQAN